MTSSRPLREGLALGSVAALIWGGAVTLRIASALEVSAALAFVALAGAGAALLGPLVAFGARAARGPGDVAPALLVGIGLALGPLWLLGVVVHARTHHRPLGAVTLALAGAALVVAGMVFARRAQTWTNGEGAPRRWPLQALGAVGALSVLGVAAVGAVRGGGAVALAMGDAAMGAIAVVACLKLSARMRALAPAGIFVWATLVGAAVVALRWDTALGEQLWRVAPVPLAGAALLAP